MKKMIKKISAAVFLALLCLAWLPLNASASEKTEIKIPVSVNLTGAEPERSENYIFRLIPESGRTPMPEGCEGSCDIAVSGNGTAEFAAIGYTVPGIYGYTVKQIPGNDVNCTYDNTVYYVRVTVSNAENGSLEISLSAHRDKQMEDKKQMIEFDNTYAEPPVVEKKETIQTVTKTQRTSSLIQTGQFKWPVPVLAGAGMLLTLAGVRMTRKRKTEHV